MGLVSHTRNYNKSVLLLDLNSSKAEFTYRELSRLEACCILTIEVFLGSSNSKIFKWEKRKNIAMSVFKLIEQIGLYFIQLNGLTSQAFHG